MLVHNENISAAKYKALRSSMQNAIERLTNGLKYGEDMKSSAFVSAHDAMNILQGIIDQIAA